MSQEKPGLSNEEGKPTPGQIGLVDGDKLVEWILKNYQKPLGLNSSTAGMVMVKLEIQSGRFSVSGHGQEERDLSPEEAQLEVTKRFGQGSSVQVDFEVNSDWTWTKRVTLFDWESNEISEAETFREAFANADKAEAEREKK